jgi:cell division protein ZapA (FtsZ GTPase activity inhibitor)
MRSQVQVPPDPPFTFGMSIKVAIGSKIYDISNFSEEQQEDVIRLSKSLNFRVNQVISAFGIYDQEMALIMASLSLLEEIKTFEEETKSIADEVDLFNYKVEGQKDKLYSAEEVEQIVLESINSLNKKLKSIIPEN